jgi:hypothetical protein
MKIPEWSDLVFKIDVLECSESAKKLNEINLAHGNGAPQLEIKTPR